MLSHQVTIHGHGRILSSILRGDELADVNLLKNAAHDFPSPPPLMQSKDLLQKQITG